jgi:hypothetical protein
MPVTRKAVTTRSLTKENALEMANRELVPKLRELAAMQRDTEVTGSRGGATAAVLAQVLTILQTAGIITDSTTP